MKLVAAAIMMAGGALAFAVASTGTSIERVGNGQAPGAAVMAVGCIVFAIEYYRSWKKGGGEN